MYLQSGSGGCQTVNTTPPLLQLLGRVMWPTHTKGLFQSPRLCRAHRNTHGGAGNMRSTCDVTSGRERGHVSTWNTQTHTVRIHYTLRPSPSSLSELSGRESIRRREAADVERLWRRRWVRLRAVGQTTPERLRRIIPLTKTKPRSDKESD